MKALYLALYLLLTVAARAQLPTGSPEAEGFDPARLEVMHAGVKLLVEDKPLIETWPEPGRGIEAGGAGIFSTADDYARFAQMLCNGGTLDGKHILGRKTIELMTANHVVMRNTVVAMGLSLDGLDPIRIVIGPSHNGTHYDRAFRNVTSLSLSGGTRNHKLAILLSRITGSPAFRDSAKSTSNSATQSLCSAGSTSICCTRHVRLSSDAST
jgi:hypothetical protein